MTALNIISAVLAAISLVIMLFALKIIKEAKAKNSKNQTENTATKEDIGLLMSQLADNLSVQLKFLNQNINGQTASGSQQMENLRTAVGGEMQLIRQENAETLAEIRRTVDEKLENTLEKRLNQSFSQVGERLEQVHQGLGEMQNLAANVGDLQKLLRNVKIRGTWGEVQLGGILRQMLAAEQYQANVKPNPDSGEIVEYCVKIPDDKGSFAWLPIDAKFPLEDYQRLQTAEEKGDAAEKAKALTALGNRIKAEAKDIKSKYIQPPYTTEFAVLFLPLEGLFAEVIRQTELWEALQRDYKVLVAGPTTLAALLNMVQLGFQSAAIRANTDEVWQILGQIKNEFGLFNQAVEKSRKKLQEAANSLENVGRRARVMERKLTAAQSGKANITEAEATGSLSENTANNITGEA